MVSNIDDVDADLEVNAIEERLLYSVALHTSNTKTVLKVE